jgi:methylthioribose-1-phosphate isomerase
MTEPQDTSTHAETLRWAGGTDGHLVLVDQTLLPVELKYIECRDVETVWEAIRRLSVRGAPAIGIAAAYGVCVGVQTVGDDDADAFLKRFHEASDYLAGSRPTAVNLFWAIDRLKGLVARLQEGGATTTQIRAALLDEARAIHDEDRHMCREIGRHGAALMPDTGGVLTHCNAGGLATSELGTALAVIVTAHQQGKKIRAFADETRPLLQGARLTTWELQQQGVPTTLICDSMAARVMREEKIQAVITGADRIAANGDTANKIGTYSIAVLAHAHNIPFYVAAPSSTFDLALASGDEIPIEERDAAEVTHGFGRQTAPDGTEVYNPAFDVTPASLIAAIVTERGVIDPVDSKTIRRMLGGSTSVCWCG